jgi:DNA-binding CsgD family transcriptional regulator
MNLDTSTASSVLWALRLAREHGSAEAALAAAGVELPDIDRFTGASTELSQLLSATTGETSVREALAVGLLAGRVAHRSPRPRRLQDPTAFLMDRELVVQAAEGQSILRLPWFDESLFVGRRLPDIFEMPSSVRRQCIETYSAALAGQRGGFQFTSYGHSYSVDAVPVRRNGEGPVEAVLAIATPARSFTAAATAYDRTAVRLDRAAELAGESAQRYHLAGNRDAEVSERHRVTSARRGAERARANAERLRSRERAPVSSPPSVTSRQVEVLNLASHGLTSSEIAEQLGVGATTIKTHFENIFTRLGVSDRSAAVAMALRHGIID